MQMIIRGRFFLNIDFNIDIDLPPINALLLERVFRSEWPLAPVVCFLENCVAESRHIPIFTYQYSRRYPIKYQNIHDSTTDF